MQRKKLSFNRTSVPLPGSRSTACGGYNVGGNPALVVWYISDAIPPPLQHYVLILLAIGGKRRAKGNRNSPQESVRLGIKSQAGSEPLDWARDERGRRRGARDERGRKKVACRGTLRIPDLRFNDCSLPTEYSQLTTGNCQLATGNC